MSGPVSGDRATAPQGHERGHRESVAGNSICIHVVLG